MSASCNAGPTVPLARAMEYSANHYIQLHGGVHIATAMKPQSAAGHESDSRTSGALARVQTFAKVSK